MGIRPLAIQDAAWLLVEGPERPMHVGGPMLFTPPEGSGTEWVADTVQRALAFTEPRSPFNHKLVHPYGRLGTYAWTETEVDLTYHVRHLALPKPGRIRELLSLVSRLHASLLDRHRPLWEIYLIEGLADGRVALYTKIHHSMLDGVAAVRQILASFSPDPEVRDLPPPWAARPAAGGGSRQRSQRGPLGTLLHTAKAGAGVGLSSAGALRSIAGQTVSSFGSDAEVAPFAAPPSMFNVPLTGSRRVVAQSYDLDRIKAVKDAAGVTVNDVVMAMCGSALRTYLQSHDALPDRPLIAYVPVNIRTDDSSEGNAISFLLANLGTHLDDPLDRLRVVHDSMARGKERLQSMTPGERLQYGIALSLPLIASQLAGRAGQLMPPEFNVVISNVPGPSEALYWNGARLDGIYPASLLTDGYALNMTQTSYAGSMEFGITADRQRVPSVQRMIDHLEDALADLEKATGA
jgi:diacylglycerol O-acyltransferase / wax synthase